MSTTTREARPTSDLTKSVREKHKEYLFPATIQYYAEPIVVTDAKGLRVKDADGNEYLDFFGGILTVSIGHANEKVNAAVKAQVDRLSHISTLYPTLPVVELAERLSRLAPASLKQVYFTASGTEADETAVMMAELFTGRSEMIALRHGYSGRSMLAQSLTAQSSWRPLPTKIAGIKHAPTPYCYRCPMHLEYPSCGLACARDIEDIIRTTTTGRISAFLAEPIQGVGGFITPPPEYFEAAVAIVRKYGGVFICDEVQTGFGRTGTKMWGIEHWGVEPEIMTMAKGVANGLPLGVTICTPEIAASLKALTISTFGGNPVSCAAANATIQIIEEDDLAGNAERTGRILRQGLEELQRRFPKNIGDVRGLGLMQAIEFVVDETAGDRTPERALCNRVFEEARKRFLLLGKGGLDGNAFRIAPPLNVAASDVEEALGILRESLEAAGAR
jgi:4-aminobutyrate aminotransferase-like enzyme